MTTPTPIDDDHFEYDGGMRQCISGFGENAKALLQEVVNHPSNGNRWRAAHWHIDELVRWCRGLNREVKEVKAERDRLLIDLRLVRDRMAESIHRRSM